MHRAGCRSGGWRRAGARSTDIVARLAENASGVQSTRHLAGRPVLWQRRSSRNGVAIAVTYTRECLVVGVDILGEGYYSVMPQHRAQENKPFVTDSDSNPTSAVHDCPVVRVFAIVVGRVSTGRMLCMRHFCLLMMLRAAPGAVLLLKAIGGRNHHPPGPKTPVGRT